MTQYPYAYTYTDQDIDTIRVAIVDGDPHILSISVTPDGTDLGNGAYLPPNEQAALRDVLTAHLRLFGTEQPADPSDEIAQELAAMRVLSNALLELPPKARSRVLLWLSSSINADS